MIEKFSDPIFAIIKKNMRATEQVYLVGGSVRDAFLGKPVKDFDFVCENGIEFGRRLANANKFDFFILDKDFDACRVIRTTETAEKVTYDFSGYRKDTLELDLFDRDFTINAVAIELTQEKLVDPTGGLRDLQQKIIRLASPNSISTDPVRALRAIRFSTAFGFRLDANVTEQIKENAPQLVKISNERLRDELNKIWDGPKPYLGSALMDKLGVLDVLFPQLAALKGETQTAPHQLDVWEHTLNVLKQLEDILSVCAAPYNEERANADLFTGLLVLKLGRFRERLTEYFSTSRSQGRSRKANLYFAALFHDVAKPQTRSQEDSGRIRFFGHEKVGADLAEKQASESRLSASEIDAVGCIVNNHMKIHAMASRNLAGNPPTNKAIYRFFKSTGENAIDLVLLSLADLRATFGHTLPQETWLSALEVSEQLLTAWFEKRDVLIDPPNLVNGLDLMQEFKLAPGSMIGRMLEAIKEAQVMGSVATPEAALEVARALLHEESDAKKGGK